MDHRLQTGMLLAAITTLSACAGGLRWETERPPPSGKTHTVRTLPVPASPPPAAPSRPLGADEYQVVRGDTLYSIAFRNNLDFRELARWNGIGSDYRIEVGQILRLKGPRPLPPSSPVPTPAPVPAPQAPVAVTSRPVVTVPAAPTPIVVSPPPAVEAPVASIPAGYQWEWPTLGAILKGYAPAQGSKGLDIGGNMGQPVFAAAPGRVVYSGNALKGYGELIIIKHDETFLSAYGYNRKRYVAEGDFVTTGQPIGELGLGPESKPLLHFEIRKNGQPVNPLLYLPKRR